MEWKRPTTSVHTAVFLNVSVPLMDMIVSSTSALSRRCVGIVGSSSNDTSQSSTFPATGAQGSSRNKVDNVRGSNHGNLSSDSQHAAIWLPVG